MYILNLITVCLNGTDDAVDDSRI